MRRVLDRKESERLVLGRVLREIHEKYPHLAPRQALKLAKKCTTTALKKAPGGQLVLVTHPASKWQAWKEKHLPEWALKYAPVKYAEQE